MKNPDFEGFISLTSQPFGICSHGQYFPKFLAKIFFYEMNQICKNVRSTCFVCSDSYRIVRF